MTLPQCVSDSNNSTTPNSVLTVFLFCIAGIFSVELALVDARSSWWLDDLSSLWASDPKLPFRLVFGERILSDSNPPLYFSLLYCVRQIVSDDGAAVVAVNAGAIGAAAAAVFILSWRAGVGGLAVAGIAAFALSGPILYFAPEGRSYVCALSIVFVTSWYAALAIAGFPGQLSLARYSILGCLAALTHVYAALFCGSLAAGLLALAIFAGRKELLKPGLALGLSATLVFGVWLGIAFSSIENIDWIHFSVRDVLNAALSVKELAMGSYIVAIIVVGLFVFGLFSHSTRSLFIAFGVAFALFALLPLIASFMRPLITSRYWLIGASALPVALIFAARSWIVKRSGAPARNRPVAAIAVLCCLAASSALGFSNALYYLPTKPFWRGGDLVRPLLARCDGATVHVYYENSSRPYDAWPDAMFGFEKVAGSSSILFLDAQENSTPFVSAAAASCAVLGWAEHAWEWRDLKDGDLLRLLKIEASADEVQIVRHRTGFVILKAPPAQLAKLKNPAQAAPF
ncbi:MAG: hypothetical protein WAN43_07905 [Rhodomicrobium sp.]